MRSLLIFDQIVFTASLTQSTPPRLFCGKFDESSARIWPNDCFLLGALLSLFSVSICCHFHKVESLRAQLQSRIDGLQQRHNEEMEGIKQMHGMEVERLQAMLQEAGKRVRVTFILLLCVVCSSRTALCCVLLSCA